MRKTKHQKSGRCNGPMNSWHLTITVLSRYLTGLQSSLCSESLSLFAFLCHQWPLLQRSVCLVRRWSHPFVSVERMRHSQINSSQPDHTTKSESFRQIYLLKIVINMEKFDAAGRYFDLLRNVAFCTLPSVNSGFAHVPLSLLRWKAVEIVYN